MSTTCLNCGFTVNENYCSRCGQKVEVKRLTWHSLGEEIFHFFTHVEKGFLKTTVQLIMYPGKFCKSYLDGKRKAYHKPVSFLLIWITLYLFTWYLSGHFTHFEYNYADSIVTFDSAAQNLLLKYRSLIDIIILPLSALINWLIIGRPKLNYVEVLCISFYLFSFTFIFHIAHIIISPLLGNYYRNNIAEDLAVVLLAIWAIWACYDFYKQYKIPFLIPKLILWIIAALPTYFYASKIIVKLLVELGF